MSPLAVLVNAALLSTAFGRSGLQRRVPAAADDDANLADLADSIKSLYSLDGSAAPPPSAPEEVVAQPAQPPPQPQQQPPHHSQKKQQKQQAPQTLHAQQPQPHQQLKATQQPPVQPQRAKQPPPQQPAKSTPPHQPALHQELRQLPKQPQPKLAQHAQQPQQAKRKVAVQKQATAPAQSKAAAMVVQAAQLQEREREAGAKDSKDKEKSSSSLEKVVLKAKVQKDSHQITAEKVSQSKNASKKEVLLHAVVRKKADNSSVVLPTNASATNVSATNASTANGSLAVNVSNDTTALANEKVVEELPMASLVLDDDEKKKAADLEEKVKAEAAAKEKASEATAKEKALEDEVATLKAKLAKVENHTAANRSSVVSTRASAAARPDEHATRAEHAVVGASAGAEAASAVAAVARAAASEPVAPAASAAGEARPAAGAATAHASPAVAKFLRRQAAAPSTREAPKQPPAAKLSVTPQPSRSVVSHVAKVPGLPASQKAKSTKELAQHAKSAKPAALPHPSARRARWEKLKDLATNIASPTAPPRQEVVHHPKAMEARATTPAVAQPSAQQAHAQPAHKPLTMHAERAAPVRDRTPPAHASSLAHASSPRPAETVRATVDTHVTLHKQEETAALHATKPSATTKPVERKAAAQTLASSGKPVAKSPLAAVLGSPVSGRAEPASKATLLAKDSAPAQPPAATATVAAAPATPIAAPTRPRRAAAAPPRHAAAEAETPPRASSHNMSKVSRTEEKPRPAPPRQATAQHLALPERPAPRSEAAQASAVHASSPPHAPTASVAVHQPAAATAVVAAPRAQLLPMAATLQESLERLPLSGLVSMDTAMSSQSAVAEDRPAELPEVELGGARAAPQTGSAKSELAKSWLSSLWSWVTGSSPSASAPVASNGVSFLDSPPPGPYRPPLSKQEKMRLRAAAEASVEKTRPVLIGDAFASIERDDGDAQQRLEDVDRVLRVQAETPAKPRRAAPGMGADPMSNSMSKASNFWATMTDEDADIEDALSDNSKDLSRYQKLTRVQNEQVERAASQMQKERSVGASAERLLHRKPDPAIEAKSIHEDFSAMESTDGEQVDRIKRSPYLRMVQLKSSSRRITKA